MASSSSSAAADTIASTTPAGAAETMMPVTITHLVMIAIAIVLTILMIWWGQKRWHQRKASEADLEARGATVEVDGGSLSDGPSDGDNALANVVQPTMMPPVPVEPVAPPPPPVAPAPPPIADVVPATPVAAASAGDLTTLKGLGPKAAAMLAELGVTDIAALAALSDEQAAGIDGQLGPLSGRMTRDRWHEQARLLAAGQRNQYETKFGKIG
ncbi:hypothetical protein [Sphingomonas sp.]|uniref:hypothetical protein n=1 Tax=Sphingomonas sp. TaxID=28214 RepID=UPI002C81BAA6|nr:hypothetical protein [Sphingomonas sp.]HTG38054.1 hypothetical protein [Sphingomonas sp.]